PDPNGYQVGTITADTITTQSGTERVFGHFGDDTIVLRLADALNIEELNGGGGTDILVLAEGFAGTFDLRSKDISNFQEIEFEAGISGSVTRTARFDSTQIGQNTELDFDGGMGDRENLEISLSTQTTVNYSNNTIADYSLADDSISIFGDFSAENITGTFQGDFINAGSGSDTVNGGEGNDTLLALDDGAINSYNGGNGVDRLDFRAFDEAINLTLSSFSASGSLTAAGTTTNFSGIEEVRGTAFGDQLQGFGFVFGGDGNDNLRGNGDNSVFGEGGDDTFNIFGSDGTPDFFGGADTDTFQAATLGTLDMYVDLESGGYNLNSTAPLTFFSGTLSSIESYNGAFGADRVIGNDADNFIIGRPGNDTIDGGDGNDTLGGNEDDDVINGGEGNDFIFDSNDGSSDEYNGGPDTDELSYRITTDNLVINLGANFFQGGAQTGNDTINSIEDLDLGSGNDRVFGSADNNRIGGGAGQDTIAGLNGNDTILSGNGEDAISGGNGNDFINGGADDDRLFGNEDNDTILGDAGDDFTNGGNGNDSINGGADDDNVLVGGGGNDTVRGGEGGDGINGSSGDDLLRGDNGDDRLFGAAGEDTLRGDEDNDTLGGQADDDTLDGGNGEDGLNGGGGNDVMNGGAQDDRLFGGTGNDTLNGGTGDDLITGQAGIDTFV
ncbi:MAG: calcium-binding protein, partial [Pseudomonadota bacterium]